MKPQSAEFFLEVGCEEIPAGMIATAALELKAILDKYFSAEKLFLDSEVTTFGAPRRLVASCPSLRLKQEDESREVTGPPKAIAFDANGQPTRAAESFAGKQGVAVSDLYLVTTPRGEYVAAKQLTPGRATADRLNEILPRAIAEIAWPRTMYWTGATGYRFIRPIRWVVALLGRKPLNFALDDVKVGSATVGHRFLGKSHIPVTGLQDYTSKLRTNFVLANPDERRRKIALELEKLPASKGLRLNEDEELNQNSVAYLNEYPTVIMGGFDPAYLDLPEEILITVMRGHQKYFALRRKDGHLAPHFLAVINLASDSKHLVRAGHERVLRARFADARFFWEADQKCRLADYLPKLNQVTFQVKLGSYGEKVERVRSLARWLTEQLHAQGVREINVADVDRAAELSKCDLNTDMVREFPELQGVMGGLYAKAQGESQGVSTAVYDHYRPTGLDDFIPTNLTGAILALSDKLDTLVGCFAVGLIPTGSSDPFALRRSALGIVKIILDRKLPISLAKVVGVAAEGVKAKADRDLGQAAKQALDFLVERAKYILIERHGFAYDEVNAALAAGADDLVDAVARVTAVRAMRKTKNFEPLAVSFKRIRKILEKAGPAKNWKLPAVDPVLFEVDAERALYTAAQKVASEADQLKREGKYKEALQGIAKLRPEVDAFFERVMVMAEQEDIRRNRLTLLAELLAEFSTIAD